MKTLRVNTVKAGSKVTVDVPGSKSYTNRALIIASLINKPVKIIHPLDSSDTRAMVESLTTLGVKIIWNDSNINVIGSILDLSTKNSTLDVNQSGTALRFLLALCTLIPGEQILTGRDGLNERPIGDIVDALRLLGAQISYLEKQGYPPIKISSSSLSGTKVSIRGKQSSQYLSALLMISPLLDSLTIAIKGELISKPYIDMTLQIMSYFGVDVQHFSYESFSVNSQNYSAKQYHVEGDFSSAGYFFALAALTKSTVTIRNLNPASLQADKKILDYLEEMGSHIIFHKNAITIKGNGVKPLDVNMENCPDQAPTLAVLFSLAHGTSKISGIQSLRVKETERIEALQKEFAKLGIKTKSTTSTLTIYGGKIKPGIIDTYSDHRMAMSFALVGTVVPNIYINNPVVVNKTFPGFWKQFEKFPPTQSTGEKNIVLIGMRGSGKTSIAKMLGTSLERKVLDLDTAVEEQQNQSISDFVSSNGWQKFRLLENEIVRSIENTTNMIISTGGGVILDSSNTDSLKLNGYVIWLHASCHTLYKRLKKSHTRYPLTDSKNLLKELMEVYGERNELYTSAADHIINTDKLTEQEVHDIIIQILRDRMP